jgi:hypothetical protein
VTNNLKKITTGTSTQREEAARNMSANGNIPDRMTMDAPWTSSIARSGSRLEITFRGALFSHIRQ